MSNSAAGAVRTGNLFETLPKGLPEEFCEAVVIRGDVRVERIVSSGQASPPDFWYDQDEDEFVVLMAGAATLRIEGRKDSLDLLPGVWVEIPAHCRHRVEWTQAEPPTVWLAIFLPARGANEKELESRRKAEPCGDGAILAARAD